MNAVIMYPQGERPRYAEFPNPVPANDDDVLITVRAATIKHIDRGRASGKH